MPSFYTILTDVGQAKLANAIVLGQTIEITQMAVGDGNGALPTPETSRTALVNEVRRASINLSEVDDQNPNWVVVEQVLPPDVGGWTIREIGVFDVDGDLIGYGNYPETYKPVLAEGSSRTQTIRFVMEVSDTAAITLKVDPSVVLATRGYADTAVEEHSAETAGVHGIPVGKAAIHTGLKATTAESQQGTADKYPDAAGVHAAILANPYKPKAIGEPFALWDHLAGVTLPDNSGTAKYIKLTAGEDGVGGFNEGLLENEVISGSFPTLQASAEVAVGPLAGQSVYLINTMEAFLRARETSGASQQAEIESHSHSSQNAMYTSSDVQVGSGGTTRGVNNGFVSSTGSYGGIETRVKNVSATYYMRIA